MEVKKCSKCDESKNVSNFTFTKTSNTYKNECKQCVSKRMKRYRRQKENIPMVIHNHQKQSSLKRGHSEPTYTRLELKEWLYSQGKFHTLYDEWKASEYSSNLRPSVDRKNDYIGYTINNIQLGTWADNKEKARTDAMNGNNTKRCKKVFQYDLNEKFIKEHHSVRSAAREVKGNSAHISSVCKGTRSSTSGFVWKYSKV